MLLKVWWSSRFKGRQIDHLVMQVQHGLSNQSKVEAEPQFSPYPCHFHHGPRFEWDCNYPMKWLEHSHTFDKLIKVVRSIYIQSFRTPKLGEAFHVWNSRAKVRFWSDPGYGWDAQSLIGIGELGPNTIMTVKIMNMTYISCCTFRPRTSFIKPKVMAIHRSREGRFWIHSTVQMKSDILNNRKIF